ncbi:hypothetical protein CI109_101683 [Kwoniella shandongensis]|uniref:Uncharacterized protein n=1 Tax=Kwoniella shandongensis TaxID=1734106 RepID=A0A5M6C6T3_9TREE|nr:uncharacterized protein CI109_001193 [Kwoniella shandongensis]KAA5530390.1 hypothetical protein CI109_001193 [Kwoniella shandongensis]
MEGITTPMREIDSGSPSDDTSSGWMTTSSWESGQTITHQKEQIKRPRLAWASVRHRSSDEKETVQEELEVQRGDVAHCSQAVLITCLHLSHEMALREVGMYAWTTPTRKDPMGSMTKIMKQYMQQLKALSKQSDLLCRAAPDPSKSVIQHHLQKARLAAGTDSYIAVLYNGHGIQEPPTEAGELWCYDRSFDDCLQNGGGPTEYIPIMLFDLLTWAGASSCYVWDCQHAGRFIRCAQSTAEEIDSQLRAAAIQDPSVAEMYPAIYSHRQMHFAACGAHQSIPRIDGMPDDLFTACLVTPLRVALLFHNLQSFPLTKGDGERRRDSYMIALWENMSSDLKDRLNSELSSIVRTIAWQSLEGREYQKLFTKSGVLVNNLSVGFVLSQRVLGCYRIAPESIPTIPSLTSQHALWTTWDLILDNLFEQLPKYFDETVPTFSLGGSGGGANNLGRMVHHNNKGSNSSHRHIWEKDLKLVSFMADQLESITTSGQNLLHIEVPSKRNTLTSTSGSSTSTGSGSGTNRDCRTTMTPSLSRLPIICAAALIPSFKIQACTALDSSLRILDRKGLVHAVQGGALEVAVKLLDLPPKETEGIERNIISIWASLVRYDSCVLALGAGKGKGKGKGLEDQPAIKFFMNALELNLAKMEKAGSGSGDELDHHNQAPDSKIGEDIIEQVIQTAAVLCTIFELTNDRIASTGIVDRVLGVAKTMMSRSDTSEIVKQWGALLVAGILGSIESDRSMRDRHSGIKNELISLIKSSNVESRASAVYALTRYVPTISTVTGEERIDSILDLSDQLVEYTKSEGSPLVRRELARIFIIILEIGEKSTIMTMWTYFLQHALSSACFRENQEEAIKDSIKRAGKRIGVTPPMETRMRRITEILRVLEGLYEDPDKEVKLIVRDGLKEMISDLRGSANAEGSDGVWKEVLDITFSSTRSEDVKWTDEMLRKVLAVADLWEGKPTTPVEKYLRRRNKKLNNDLFEKSKVDLQAYLIDGRRGGGESTSGSGKEIGSQDDKDAHEKTWTLRYRQLEDSIVIAEQQVGLPWRWALKDISSPDPWSKIACHSFGNTILACNKTHDLLLWDWTASRKTGHVHLDLPSNAAITSARFINELHEQTVILAEINNGDIHILSGPQDVDPALIKPVACFKALEITSSNRSGMGVESDEDKKLVTSWYRTKGQLCVGGASGIVNVWDAPAERCVLSLETASSSPVTTITTEPVSGNLIFTGFANGQIKLFDLRQSRRTASLSWSADGLVDTSGDVTLQLKGLGTGIKEIGIVLGESKHVTSACSNGVLNVFDLRHLTLPTSSTLVQQNGIASASFQPHSGLMSTVSNLSLPSSMPYPLTTNSDNAGRQVEKGDKSPPASPSKLSNALSHLHLKPKTRTRTRSKSKPKSKPTSPTRISDTSRSESPSAKFALFRSTLGSLTPVTEETISFSSQTTDADMTNGNGGDGPFKPYTTIHPLRPFLGVGYGRECHLIGCGVGQGDDTDSGSWSWLKSQAKLGS